MELDQLRHLDAIARHGTVSKAADELRLSQPALSRSIQRLEAELGAPLFDRTKNRLALNDAGRLALEHAREVLRDIERLRDAVRDFERGQRTLRVGTCAPAPLWRLASLVSEALPEVILTTETLSRKDLERDLMSERIDLAVLPSPFPVPTVSCAPFMHENLFLSVPEGHPLAARASIDLSEVDGETFLLYTGIGFWRDLCRDRLPNARFVEQDDYLVFGQMASATPLLSFSSDAHGAALAAQGRALLPIRDAGAHVTFYLASLNENRERLTPVLDMAREARQR